MLGYYCLSISLHSCPSEQYCFPYSNERVTAGGDSHIIAGPGNLTPENRKRYLFLNAPECTVVLL